MRDSKFIPVIFVVFSLAVTSLIAILIVLSNSDSNVTANQIDNQPQLAASTATPPEGSGLSEEKR